jgi:hypothetical protein
MNAAFGTQIGADLSFCFRSAHISARSRRQSAAYSRNVMRRAALTVMVLLPLALLALGGIAWQRLANASYDELIAKGASEVRVERANWRVTRIRYALPPAPKVPVTEQLQVGLAANGPPSERVRLLQRHLYTLGWIRMEGAERTGPTLFESGVTRVRYHRSYLFGLAGETVLLAAYDGSPTTVSITVIRALYPPRPPKWLRDLWR